MIRISRSNFRGRGDLHCLVAAAVCLLSLNPFFIWGWARECQVLTLLTLALLYAPHYVNTYEIKLGFCIFSLIFYVFIASNASWLGALYFAASAFFIVQLTADELAKTFHLFSIFFAASLAPAVFLWVVHHVLGDNSWLALGYVDEAIMPDAAKIEAGQRYIKYPFAVVLDYMLDMKYYRLHGPYDEPGVVGTIAALMLAVNKYKVKSISNIFILMAGILSFSLAFFFLAGIYLILQFLRRPLHSVLIVIVLLIFSAFLFENNELHSLTVDRMSLNAQGGFSGDNRSSDFLNEAFGKWEEADLFTFMFGEGSLQHSGTSSWKQIPIQIGIFGLVLLILIFILLYIRHCLSIEIYALMFSILFFSSMYQRPGVLIPVYILIFIAGTLPVFNQRKFAR